MYSISRIALKSKYPEMSPTRLTSRCLLPHTTHPLTSILLLSLHHLYLCVDNAIPQLHCIANIIECHIHCIYR